ncbi:hypothetical protein G7Y89_g13216 [Cudoniella acicularis]|uniref:Major facilitator superfamily (MFS) profile domain-containing protein n=1 Tax=Cudoniella acicularis TaxID=354080 RepID=A0A8H4RA20_9HELO|nr:hypothetical protein G7Y89_g13216 [Cudoniella acicularis]
MDSERTSTSGVAAEKSDISLRDPANLSDIEKGEADAPASPRSVHGIAWCLVVLATLSSIFLYALDNTIVAVLVPAIINDFNSVDQLAWLSSASALCGGSPNMSAIIVGRVFAGMGGIGMYLGVMTLISVNTSDRERPAYLSLVGLVWGIGTVLGPVVGGGFEKVTWRWAFYINLIIGGIFAPVYLFLLPSFNPAPGASFKAQAIQVDWLGAALSIGALVSLVMSINFGGTFYAFNSGSEIALWVVTGVLFIAFALQQTFTIFTTVTSRMFPVHFFKNKEALLLFVAAAACNAAAFVPIYYIPVYFQFTRGDDALQSAVRLLPLIFILSATILTNGFFMTKLGYYQPWYCGGSIVALVAGVLISRIDSTTSTASIYGFEVLLGLGAGAFIQAGYAVIQTAVEPADMYYAISFMMLAQVGGIALALSICGTILVNTATTGLQVAFPQLGSAAIQEIISGTSNAFVASLSAVDQELALETVVKSLQKVFIPAYVASAVAFVTSVFLKRSKVFIPTAAAG